jgi:hypothetical protein
VRSNRKGGIGVIENDRRFIDPTSKWFTDTDSQRPLLRVAFFTSLGALSEYFCALSSCWAYTCPDAIQHSFLLGLRLLPIRKKAKRKQKERGRQPVQGDHLLNKLFGFSEERSTLTDALGVVFETRHG